jgi:hypothetical protein
MLFLDANKVEVVVEESVAMLLESCFIRKAGIKEALDSLEVDKKVVDEDAATLMAVSGVWYVKGDQGTLSMKNSSTSRLDKALLQEELLRHGLSAFAIADIMKAATVTKPYAFVEFRKVGNGKKGG